MRPRKNFLFFLLNAATAGSFYVDINGVIQSTNAFSYTTADGAQHLSSLDHAPDGWENQELKFSRSTTYFGINRTYTEPFRFVRDGAFILRSTFYKGRGADENIALVVLKWNPNSDVFELYYKGLLDMSTFSDEADKGVTVNIMEGGIVQALKAYEKSVFEIPCDGSIEQNFKIYDDGIEVEDTFHYAIPAQNSVGDDNILALTFISNDGDNSGVIRGEPTLQPVTIINTPSPFQSLANAAFQSETATTVNISGSIIVKKDANLITDDLFNLVTQTSLTVNGTDPGTGDFESTHTTFLVPALPPKPAGNFQIRAYQTIANEQRFSFSLSIDLAANEKLFFTFFGGTTSNRPIEILGGNVDINFTSRGYATTIWAITAYDIFRLIIAQINLLSSTTLQPTSYQADSVLLSKKLNLCFASGSAITASGDVAYNKAYNTIQSNPYNTDFQFFNFFYSSGQ